MDWGKIAEFFTLEAVAAYVVALGGWALVGYRAWKSRQGRHVVCTVTQRPFSHLTLSHMARKRVTVEFTAEDQAHPMRINALSQVVIDIKNDSAVDSLNDIELEFNTPQARVLRVWWEKAPEYLCKESQLRWPSIDESSDEERKPIDPSSRVQIFLSQLKSWKKYGEEVRVGILADGPLEGIGMIPKGSKAGVPLDQVWTAKFVDSDQYQRKSGIIAFLRYTSWTLVLVVTFVFIGLSLALWGPVQLGSITLGASYLDLLLGILFGFLGAGVLGRVLQRRRIALAAMGQSISRRN